MRYMFDDNKLVVFFEQEGEARLQTCHSMSFALIPTEIRYLRSNTARNTLLTLTGAWSLHSSLPETSVLPHWMQMGHTHSLHPSILGTSHRSLGETWCFNEWNISRDWDCFRGSQDRSPTTCEKMCWNGCWSPPCDWIWEVSVLCPLPSPNL